MSATYFFGRYIPLIALCYDLHCLRRPIVILFTKWWTLLDLCHAKRMDRILSRCAVINEFTFGLRKETCQHHQ